MSFCNLLDGEGWFKDIGLDEILASEDMPAYIIQSLKHCHFLAKVGHLPQKRCSIS